MNICIVELLAVSILLAFCSSVLGSGYGYPKKDYGPKKHYGTYAHGYGKDGTKYAHGHYGAHKAPVYHYTKQGYGVGYPQVGYGPGPVHGGGYAHGNRAGYAHGGGYAPEAGHGARYGHGGGYGYGAGYGHGHAGGYGTDATFYGKKGKHHVSVHVDPGYDHHHGYFLKETPYKA